MSKIIPGLLYSESHEWVKVDGGVAIIGVTDYAQSELGDITYVDMPQKGDEVTKECEREDRSRPHQPCQRNCSRY